MPAPSEVIERLWAHLEEARHAARAIIKAYQESEDPDDFEWWLEEEAVPLWPWLTEPEEAKDG